MRHPDWEKRLVAVTEAHINTPLVWGQSDCLLTVADAIEAVTGEDPAAAVRGKYKSKVGAYKLIKKQGFSDLVGVFTDRYELVPVALAARGDAGIFVNEAGDQTAGYFCEYGFAVKGEEGLRLLPRMMATHAFRIG